MAFKQQILEKGDIPKVFRTGLLKGDASPMSKLLKSIEKSAALEEAAALKKEIRPRSSPNKRVLKGRASGETSEEEEMGVTPSDFNFLNQRFDPEITLEANAESIGEESLECEEEEECKKGHTRQPKKK